MERSIERDHGEVLRDELAQRDRICAILRDAPLTIPEIAERLGAPGHEVVLWVMAMWRYGALVESPRADDDGYFSYGLGEKAAG